MSQALDGIAAERLRQMEVEGWSLEHDDQRTDGSLSRAATCYAAHASAYQRVAQDVSLETYRSIEPRQSTGQFGWPWAPSWWKPKNPRRDLIRAGALIVAEIERLDRAAPAERPMKPESKIQMLDEEALHQMIYKHVHGDMSRHLEDERIANDLWLGTEAAAKAIFSHFAGDK